MTKEEMIIKIAEIFDNYQSLRYSLLKEETAEDERKYLLNFENYLEDFYLKSFEGEKVCHPILEEFLQINYPGESYDIVTPLIVATNKSYFVLRSNTMLEFPAKGFVVEYKKVEELSLEKNLRLRYLYKVFEDNKQVLPDKDCK